MPRSMTTALALVLWLTSLGGAQTTSSTGVKNESSSTSPAAKRTPARLKARVDAPVVQLLKMRVDAIDWEDRTFGDVIEWLEGLAPVNVVVSWREMEAVGIDRDTPLTLRMRDATVASILTTVLEQLGEGDTVRWRGQGNTLKISTREAFNRKMHTRVYDVADLVFPVPDFPTPNIGPVGGGGGFGGGGGLGGGGLGGGGLGGGGLGGGGFGGGGLGGGGLGGGDFGGGGLGGGFGGGGFGGGGFGGGGFGGQGGGGTGQGAGQEGSVEENLEKLVELIKNTIEPESWDDTGGKGTIRIWRQSLVIRNNIEVHEKIGGPFYVEDF